jgi:1-acyl-sn-glycerol-3-phosphate acyltransferase
MEVPDLPPNVPRGGSVFTAALGRAVLGLLRFRFEGTIPDVPRGVMIVAPHTSNWDFLVGLAAKAALNLGAHWLGKHTIFRPAPVAALMRATGGIPVDRSSPETAVDAVTRAFAEHEKLIIAIAPEGTRVRVERWKTGFYRFAKAANVPILPVAFDWGQRRVTFLPAFHPTGNYEADVAVLQAMFLRSMALRSEGFWA